MYEMGHVPRNDETTRRPTWKAARRELNPPIGRRSKMPLKSKLNNEGKGWIQTKEKSESNLRLTLLGQQ